MLRALVALAALAAVPASAAAPTFAEGEAHVQTYHDCAADRVPLVGVGDGEGLWRFRLAHANTDLSWADCLWADEGSFEGPWDPAVGGCLSSDQWNDLCLRFPEPTADGVRYEIDYCTGLRQDCYRGAALLRFRNAPT